MNLMNMLFSATLAKASADIPSYMVVIIGIGTVFVGLVCIVIICKILGYFCNMGADKKETAVPAAATPAVPQTAKIENRTEVVAAISAAIAEELGTDVSGIRIVSIKKV